jgi:hypothetical protein
LLGTHLNRQGYTIHWVEIILKGPQSHDLVSSDRDQETSVLMREINCADMTRLIDKFSTVKQLHLLVNLLAMNRRAIESK